jgi:hypothetical protein
LFFHFELNACNFNGSGLTPTAVARLCRPARARRAARRGSAAARIRFLPALFCSPDKRLVDGTAYIRRCALEG